jgi:hypothetical protein
MLLQEGKDLTATFTHSGDLGDLIYSLPAIRAKGGGHLYLRHSPGKTAHKMSQEKCNRVRPLLLAQPYIHSVTYDDHAPESSLDGFRDHYGAGNLADMHLSTQGLSWEERATAWLTVTPNPSYEVIFVRTQRYNNLGFDWGRIYRKYKNKAVFFGLADEHAVFERDVGHIPRIDETNFLTLAEYIAGSSLYVGNYTSLSAIAEGLKHPRMILEVYPQQHHLAIFQRFGCLLGWDHKIELPEITCKSPIGC